MIQQIHLQIFFIVSIVSLFCILFTPIANRLAKKLLLFDLPPQERDKFDDTKIRRIHDKLLLRSGGIVVIVGLFIGLFLLNYLNLATYLQSYSFISAIIILSVVGLIDDRFQISGKWQMLAQIIACTIIVYGGGGFIAIDKILPGILQLDLYQIKVFSHIVSLPADIISVLFLLVILNAINWLDGIGGLATGVTGISAFTMMVIELRQGNLEIALLSAVLLGVCIGYLPHHFPPNRTYPATAGAFLFGLILGYISIVGQTKVASSFIVLLLPVIDFLWVLGWRIYNHKIINPLKLMSISDGTHLHHRLLNFGFTQRQVSLIEYSIVIFFGIISIALAGANKITILAIAALLILLIFIFIDYKRNKLKK